MKPVEIEFIMRDKLSPGIDKAGKSAETLGDKAEQVSKSITDRIAAQKEQIKYVESCLKDLKKQYDNLAPGKAQLEMRAEIDACTKALQEDKNILSSLEAEHDKAAVSTKRLSMQLREMQDAMARLRLEGKQNTKEYADMADKAAVLADTIGDLRTQTNILANDDAALQGVMSGVNGLSGLFTTATGVMGIFASENEDLIKIQTRVQSVMAVTMGLQQVMNTLNKDSAFRLVTVVKMKKLLTAANTKLAVSLGISNAAATALMATLTLGLSAVITGLIVLWDKYSDAQEKAAEKAKERVKIESDGRAQMIKTRFEIENTTKSLKDFTGSKEQEKAKVEELNRKYGESFGYYNTVAEWYDVLIQKSDDYIQMLFLQAKAQSLVNKAVEADEKVNEVKATPESDVEGSMGWFSKMGLYMAQSESYGQIDAQWKIQCKLPPKTKRFCPLKTFNNAPLKSLDRWGYYYFSLFPSVCSHFTDTFSCQLNPVRRMYNTIHNGICYCRVSDCIIPIVRWQLRGDDDGLAPMSVLYYIEQDGSFLGIKVHKEEVIQYEQRAPFDSLEFRFQCAFYFCHLKRTHKFRSIRIICPYALLAGFIPHCCGKEALPGTG